MTITDSVKQKKPKHKLLEKYTIKERTRKQKADIFMGIVFQIYLCIPWININGKYNTIHMYLIKAFRQNDYVDIYIQTFLKTHTWPQQYSRMAALIFLLAIIAMFLVQCLELFKLYQNIKGINNSNYLLAIGIAWFAVFYIFLAALDAHSEGLIKLYSMPAYFYMITFLALIVVWIFLDMQANIWDDETAKHKAELEECDKKLLQMKINSLEAQYKEMLKSRKVVHDMKNHLIVIDGYASQHNDKKIHEYIHNISEDLSLTNAVDSGSHIVSALIAEKEDKAKLQNIRCEINISTPGINIDDFSITTIIGNLFDNAIKAAAECEHGWIRFSITQTGSYMNIVIENSYSGNIIENNGEFTSTKNDKVLPHGIGIKNVRKVVSNLNGHIDFSYASGYFSVKAELPNYS